MGLFEKLWILAAFSLVTLVALANVRGVFPLVSGDAGLQRTRGAGAPIFHK